MKKEDENGGRMETRRRRVETILRLLREGEGLDGRQLQVQQSEVRRKLKMTRTRIWTMLARNRSVLGEGAAGEGVVVEEEALVVHAAVRDYDLTRLSPSVGTKPMPHGQEDSVFVQRSPHFASFQRVKPVALSGFSLHFLVTTTSRLRYRFQTILNGNKA